MSVYTDVAAQPAHSRANRSEAGADRTSRRSPVGEGHAAQAAALSPFSQPGYAAQQAALGFSGSGGTLPYADIIQQAFGRHDVSRIDAHIGGAAAVASRALGARAYAMDGAVAFASQPDLHTAAHEAAHVIQQRSGKVQLTGGIDKAGDQHERHADAVADAVVAGRSAEALLDRYAGAGATASSCHTGTVQRVQDAYLWSNAVDLTEIHRGADFVSGHVQRHVSHARETIRPWVAVRKNPDHVLPPELAQGLGIFEDRVKNAIRGELLEATREELAAVEDAVLTQVKAELSKGTFAQYLSEVAMLHGKGLDLCEWLGIDVPKNCHHYKLEVTTIAAVGGGLGLGAGLAEKAYRVIYTNSCMPGLDWEHSFASLEGAVMATTPGVAATADDTTMYTVMGANHYFRPSFFTQDADLTAIGVEAGVTFLGTAHVIGDSMVMFSDGKRAASFIPEGSELSKRLHLNIPTNGQLPKDLKSLDSFLEAQIGASVSKSLVELIHLEYDRPEWWAIGDPNGLLDHALDRAPGSRVLMHQGALFFADGKFELTQGHLEKIDLMVRRMNQERYQPRTARFEIDIAGRSSSKWDAIAKPYAELEAAYQAGDVSPEKYRARRDELLAAKHELNLDLAMKRAQEAYWAIGDRLDGDDVKLSDYRIEEAMAEAAETFDADLHNRMGTGEFSERRADQRVSFAVYVWFE